MSAHSFDSVARMELRPPTLTKAVPKQLKIGMVGLGRVVQNSVLPAYRAGGLNVVAACDPSPDARERARSTWGVERTYAGFDEMLDAEDLDVVDINLRWDRGMSPERVQAVRAAAERGVHVLIAKPLAATYDQCEDIVTAARDGGITLAVNQNSRYAPTYFACGQLVRDGVIGDVLSAGIAFNSARGIQRTPDFDAVHDVAIHELDVLLSWFNREPELVFAHESRRTSGGSVVAAILSFSGGANASLRDDFSGQHKRSWDCTLAGEEGSIDGMEDIEIPEAGQPRMLRGMLRVGFHHLPGAAVEVPLAYRYAPESFFSTMAALLQAVDSGEEPWASGSNVLRTMRTLFAVKRSVSEGIAVAPSSISHT
jgi:predicted dehydrogenase